MLIFGLRDEIMIYRKFYSELGKLVYAVTEMEGASGIVDKKRLIDSTLKNCNAD